MKLFHILTVLATSTLGVQTFSLTTSSTSTSSSQTTSFGRCSTAASTSMKRCVSAIQAIHMQETNEDSYSEDLEQCWCSSISNMIECYTDTSTSTVSSLLSSWATKGCDAKITGTVPGTAALSDPTSGTGSSATQTAEESTATGNENGGNAVIGSTLSGWWIMPTVMVAGVVTGGFAVWL